MANALSFDEAELEEGMRQVRGIAKARAESDYSCGRCILREKCGKGCMANADQLTGDPLADDGGCEFRKMEIVTLSFGKLIREEL